MALSLVSVEDRLKGNSQNAWFLGDIVGICGYDLGDEMNTGAGALVYDEWLV